MINELRPYENYRDVGLPWLPELPVHWELKRGKSVWRAFDERSTTGREELLSVSSTLGVVPRRSVNVTMFKAESYKGYKLCWPGDLVINSLWAWGRGLGVSRYHGIVSTAYGVYRPRPQYAEYGRYFHELLRSEPFNWELHVRSKGIYKSRLQISDIAFLDAPVPLPPPEEQAAIVRFLAEADRRINRLIRNKRRLIELLNEQKQAIITHAVTRGLDPSVPLKPSGTDMLEALPETWDAVPLRRVITRAVDGPHHSPGYVNEGVMFISARNIRVDSWQLDDAKYISPEDYEEFSKRIKPERGDVLYTKGGTTGIARAVDLDFPFQVWVHVAVLKLRREVVDPEYLALALNSTPCYEQSQLFTRGATNQDLGLGRMKGIWLPLPPSLSEQQAIVEATRQSTSRINDSILKATSEIDLLREYRTRLIADVVTGKLDVRAAAADLPDVAGTEPELAGGLDTDADLETAEEELEEEAVS